IAHVIGHSDFFKNNAFFQHTSRQMAETAGGNAERIRAHEVKHGEGEGEKVLDAVLSVQEHIDPNLRVKRPEPAPRDGRPKPPGRTTPYDDLWRLGEQPEEPAQARPKIPEEPEKDVLRFLMDWAPDLDDWQRDILGIVR